MKTHEHRHTISALVENEHGVLARIAGLFAARGFNIESLTVGPTEDPTLSRMTIALIADDETMEQVIKQLRRIPTTIKVQDFLDTPVIKREMVLVHVKVAEGARRLEVLEIVRAYGGRILALAPKALVVELTGAENEMRLAVECLRPYGIKELARSGRVAIESL